MASAPGSPSPHSSAAARSAIAPLALLIADPTIIVFPFSQRHFIETLHGARSSADPHLIPTTRSQEPSNVSTMSNAPAPWWRSAVIHQGYIRSFADENGDGIGGIAGLRSCLPYLARLSVDAIWINPWYPSPWPTAATTYPTTGTSTPHTASSTRPGT